MIVYIYDGSFEGLMTAVYEAYYRSEKPYRIISCSNLQIDILERYIHIETDAEKSSRVYNSIKAKISVNALKNIYHVYLSELYDAGTIIYEYLKLGYRVGHKVDLYLSDDRVLKVHQISRRVELETHRLKGFVRFKLLERNIYYAAIGPDYNIIALLAPHFAKRFSDQNWVIYDKKRNLAAIFNCKEWVIADAKLDRIPDPEKSELEYQKLWKEFFQSVGISSRSNPGLQKRMMPVRYWNYLTEMW